jgi:hypothetical protein
MSIFERIVPGWVVEEAVVSTLRLWFNTYLTEVERQWSIEKPLARPNSYNVVPENNRYVEEQLPAILVISPGLDGTPRMDGAGSYIAPFRITIAVIVAAPDKKTVERNTKTAAIRAMMLQKRGFNGLCEGIRWDGEDYTPTGTENRRSYGAATVDFVLDIADVVNKKAGPAAPDAPNPDQPGSEWPEIETVFLEVDREGV